VTEELTKKKKKSMLESRTFSLQTMHSDSKSMLTVLHSAPTGFCMFMHIHKNLQASDTIYIKEVSRIEPILSLKETITLFSPLKGKTFF